MRWHLRGGPPLTGKMLLAADPGKCRPRICPIMEVPSPGGGALPGAKNVKKAPKSGRPNVASGGGPEVVPGGGKWRRGCQIFAVPFRRELAPGSKSWAAAAKFPPKLQLSGESPKYGGAPSYTGVGK